MLLCNRHVHIDKLRHLIRTRWAMSNIPISCHGGYLVADYVRVPVFAYTNEGPDLKNYLYYLSDPNPSYNVWERIRRKYNIGFHFDYDLYAYLFYLYTMRGGGRTQMRYLSQLLESWTMYYIMQNNYEYSERLRQPYVIVQYFFNTSDKRVILLGIDHSITERLLNMFYNIIGVQVSFKFEEGEDKRPVYTLTFMYGEHRYTLKTQDTLTLWNASIRRAIMATTQFKI